MSHPDTHSSSLRSLTRILVPASLTQVALTRHLTRSSSQASNPQLCSVTQPSFRVFPDPPPTASRRGPVPMPQKIFYLCVSQPNRSFLWLRSKNYFPALVMSPITCPLLYQFLVSVYLCLFPQPQLSRYSSLWLLHQLVIQLGVRLITSSQLISKYISSSVLDIICQYFNRQIIYCTKLVSIQCFSHQYLTIRQYSNSVSSISVESTRPIYFQFPSDMSRPTEPIYATSDSSVQPSIAIMSLYL